MCGQENTFGGTFRDTFRGISRGTFRDAFKDTSGDTEVPLKGSEHSEKPPGALRAPNHQMLFVCNDISVRF